MLKYILFNIALLGGCTSQPPIPSHNINTKPSWIKHPNQNNKIGAIGVANKTYDLKVSSQRKLAITRALEELSLQQGVEVKLNLTKHETATNHSVNTQIDTKSNFKSTSTLSAHIEDTYKDAYTNQLYIWIVAD